MSDARMRELERRWREGGDDDDRAAWLAERLRAGALEPARAELAAWVGDPAARLALGQPPLPPLGPGAPAGTEWLSWGLHELEKWARGLEPWAELPLGTSAQLAPAWRQQVPGRALVALARRAWEGETADDASRHALEATESWLRDPGSASVERVATVNRVEALARDSARAALSRLALLHCGLIESHKIPAILCVRILTYCNLKEGKLEVERPYGAIAYAACGAATLVGEEAVRTALRDALAPWALGERDPLG